jgi:hypothetical protein
VSTDIYSPRTSIKSQLYSVDRTKYQIQIPLPPKIDASVTMMQVEEKPDVTYSDIGGCKEQIEKLREVVETPLLSVCVTTPFKSNVDILRSRNALLALVLIPRRACFSLARQERERLFALVLSLTEPTPLLFG